MKSPLDTIVQSIEREAGARSKAARAEYERKMSAQRRAFEAARRDAQNAEHEALKEIERWRVTSIAAVDPSRPIVLSDIASVKRETASGAVVSLARVSCLEKQA